MANMRGLAELLSRHASRGARGEGYDLIVGGQRAVGVQPSGRDWIVNHVAAGSKATLPDARAADILAARIARMLAPQ